MEAVFLDHDSVNTGDLDLKPIQDAVSSLVCFESTSPQEVEERCESAELLITNKVVLTASTLQRARNLKLICTASTGVNQVDLGAAKQRGIPVCNIRDYATAAVTQHVFSLMLELARKTCQYNRLSFSGDWARSDQFCLLEYPIDDLTDKTLGVLGYGVLGQNVARLASAFGMKVLVGEHKGRIPREGRVSFEELLEQSDIVTLHCPLTEDTLQIIDEAALQCMGNSSWLINTARGDLIDQDALCRALDSGTIEAAALDVLRVEPPPLDEPLLNQTRDNLIVTPHVAWASRSARQNAINEVARNIESFQNGTVRNQVA